MNYQSQPVKFPLWQFLNQPLFDTNNKAILNPSRFWHLHRVERLERCWYLECNSKGTSN